MEQRKEHAYIILFVFSSGKKSPLFSHVITLYFVIIFMYCKKYRMVFHN